jgi:hypothetical protein
MLPGTSHRRTAKVVLGISVAGDINTLNCSKLTSKAMSELHIARCLCHGQAFWVPVAQSTGDVALQVCSKRRFHSPPAHVFVHKPLDLSIFHPELIARSPTMPFDILNPRVQGHRATPDNQLPQPTALPVTPSPMAIPILSQPAPNLLPMATPAFPPQTSANPTISPPPISVCRCDLCRLLEVPQRRYRSTRVSIETNSRIGEIIAFSKGGSGVPLRDAVENRLSGLEGGDDLMFDGFNVSAFSLRIEVRYVA